MPQENRLDLFHIYSENSAAKKCRNISVINGAKNQLSILNNIGRNLGNFFLPPLCTGCSSAIDTHENLCADCWREIDFICAPYCDVLGTPLPFNPGGKTVSAAALATKPIYDRARVVARYTGVMRRLVHGLKYSDRQDGWRLYGRLLSKAAADLLDEADLLIPVPLNRRRLWSRRFNQAALLADALSHESGIKSDPMILSRNRLTVSQVGLTISQRRKNVSGAFTIKKKALKSMDGANILLVDDVITTGATVEACAETLKQAGAARVDIVALARVTDNELAII